MTDVEIHHAGTDVPLWRLRVDPFERAGELLLDAEGHRVWEILVEELRMAGDDALQRIALHATKQSFESEHFLEGARHRFRSRRHYRVDEYHDDERDYGRR